MGNEISFLWGTSKTIPTISKGEKECQEVMKTIYPKYEFKKVRPAFLKNPKTKRNLELDLYNEDLKLAIEFNGQQHYEFVPRFHGNQKRYRDQIYRDDLKMKLCKKEGIYLIVVRYDEKDILGYIRGELEKNPKYATSKWSCNIL